jgi:hypothetical protein
MESSSHIRAEAGWRSLCRLGGVAAFVQLACILVTLVVAVTLGVQPETAAEYYEVLESDRLVGLLRLDFPTVLLLALCVVTGLGGYAALRHGHRALAALATVFICIGVTLAIADESAFSMIHLSDLFAEAATEAERERLLAAGEAVIASNMWNSTAGFMAGVFLQGGFVILSLVMLRSGLFRKGTAYTGILANGLDLAHVFVGLVWPTVGTVLVSIGGLFYLAWFPLLGLDLYKQGRS